SGVERPSSHSDRRPEDSHQRWQRETNAAHPREARRHRALIQQPDPGSQEKTPDFSKALRSREPRSINYNTINKQPRNPGREQSRRESPAREDPGGATTDGDHGHTNRGDEKAATLRRRRLRRVHIQQPNAPG